jgi:hypothetical protein
MSDNSADRWPIYHDAPPEATFALGVISAGYGRLEFAFGLFFATAIGVSGTFTSILFPKINNDVRIALIEEAVSRMIYTQEILDSIGYFIKGYRTLVFNRNMLMHSQIYSMGSADVSILLKTQRDGRKVGCRVKVTDLRRIADDMEAFRNYGEGVANHIRAPRLAERIAIEGYKLGIFPLPDKSELPNRLEYTSIQIQE